MQKLKISVLIVASLVAAPSAFALVDGQLLYGKRSVKLEGDGVDSSDKATEIKVAAHIDPIPLVPVAFGLSYSNVTFDDTDFKDFTGHEIDLEVMAWFPLDLFSLTPYGKVGYTVASSYDAEQKEVPVTSTQEVSCLDLALGIKWSPLPLLALLVEGEFGNKTAKVKDIKSKDPSITVGEKGEFDFKTQTIFVGVEVGL